MNLLSRLGAWMKTAGCLSLLGMSVVTVADICGRVNKSPIFGSEEIVTFLAVLTLALSLPYAHEHRSHIGVEVFVQRLGLAIRRKIRIFREILSILFFILATVTMFLFAHDKQISGEVSLNLGLPEHWLIYAVAVCFGVTTLVMLGELVAFIRAGRHA